MDDIYLEMIQFLDEDERMITQHMYSLNSWMYSAVKGTVSVFRHRNNDSLDWVFNDRSSVEDVGDWRFLREFLIVKTKDWDVVDTTRLISSDELEKNRDRYVVTDVYVKLSNKQDPSDTIVVKELPKFMDINKYNRLGVLYQVRHRYLEDRL